MGLLPIVIATLLLVLGISGAASHLAPGGRVMSEVDAPSAADARVAQLVSVRTDALKLVKEWSAALIVVQSGIIAVVGALIKTPPTGKLLWLIIVLFVTLIGAIYVGAVAVLGTVPYIVQGLPDRPNCDIYSQTGGIKRGRIARLPLGRLCLLQARLFVLTLVLFALFVMLRPPSSPP